MNVLDQPALGHPSEPADACLWEPANNDLDPSGESEPWAGDFDVTSWAVDDLERAEMHVALMGGWCAHHPDRPADGQVVGAYRP